MESGKSGFLPMDLDLKLTQCFQKFERVSFVEDSDFRNLDSESLRIRWLRHNLQNEISSKQQNNKICWSSRTVDFSWHDMELNFSRQRFEIYNIFCPRPTTWTVVNWRVTSTRVGCYVGQIGVQFQVHSDKKKSGHWVTKLFDLLVQRNLHIEWSNA